MLKTLIVGCEPTDMGDNSVWVDLYASEDVLIRPGSIAKVGLGVSIDEEAIKEMFMEDDSSDSCLLNKKKLNEFLSTHFLQLNPRGSMRKSMVSTTGMINLNYRKEIKITFFNPASNDEYRIKQGARIAQLSLLQHSTSLLPSKTREKV